ncbi:MAG: formylglycine-generating enzyme family protein [Paracoccaceae bacterium]|nr:formylglycine-generating enzyme family protein [Paracoccaceae bacterium]
MATISRASGPSGCCAPVRHVLTSRPEAPDPGPAVRPDPHTAGTGTASETVRIPGGVVMVGTRQAVLPLDGEAPARRKRIGPFRIDATAVTNARFREFVHETGYVTDAERIGDSFVFERFLPANAPPSRAVAEAPWWRVIDGADWRRIHGPGSDEAWEPEHPVVHVTWNDASAFADWCGGRLPSEAEWEHAARGGLGDVRYPWGNDEPNDVDFFPCNIWQGRFWDVDLGLDGYVGTAPARSFEPNGYGLFNMVGNVWEWTAQPFRVRSLKRTATRVHSGKRGYRLVKGGSFLCHASYCHRYRIAARTGSTPDSSTSHQGFRVVYD